MSKIRGAVALLTVGLSAWAAGEHGVGSRLVAQQRPNIVLIFPDNLGRGEVGVYGGVRGASRRGWTSWPREGIRLNNFNVEFSCTVSRAALMTGRYAIRTGATQAGASRCGKSRWPRR